MTPTLSPRILALPADVRETLSKVPGPGWICVRRVDGFVLPVLRIGTPRRLKSHEAWWPANPAAAVAAVLRIPLWDAHRRIYEACTRDEGDDGDDHEAALDVIEAHIRRQA